jgi:DTW domain-containing protein YfiP
MLKREVCPHCEFIIARCLCSTLRPINNLTQITILQHPSEAKHALNTVKLMKKSFLNIELIIGENFSEDQKLNSIISMHKETVGLIFPAQGSISLDKFSSQKLTHIIFIDGTWKKANKIYLLSKNLQQLSTYFLSPPFQGQYKIRASTFKNGISTLEASICALKYIEESLDTLSLEESFLKMIEFQITKMGEETFKKNYNKSDD